MESASPGGDPVLEADVPLAGHRGEVTGLTEHLGDGHASVIELPAVTRARPWSSVIQPMPA